MWRKGKRNHNISRVYTIKNIQEMQMRFIYSADSFTAKVVDYKDVVNDHRYFLGNATENYYAWQESQDYKKFTVNSITTKLEKFAIKRIISNDVTMKGTPPTLHYFEDKEDIQDPMVYFYRQGDGQDFPSCMLDPAQGGNALELCKRKCIKGCKDGWYWTTRFPRKTEHHMVDTSQLRAYMATDTQASALNSMLKAFGVHSKSDDALLKDIHDSRFALARPAPFTVDKDSPNNWYNTNTSSTASAVDRKVTDYLTFNMTSYVRVRFFHKTV